MQRNRRFLRLREYTKDMDALVFVGFRCSSGRKTLQCGSSYESRENSGTDDKDFSAELRRIL